jgi:Cu2+-containing amine oxidase
MLNLLNLVNAQVNTVSVFKTIQSKKDFLTAYTTIYNVLFVNTVKTFKNVFNITVHNTNTLFVILTLYFNSTKKYTHYVINTNTLNGFEFTTIKAAKAYVLAELVKIANNEVVETNVVENTSTVITTEEIVENTNTANTDEKVAEVVKPAKPAKSAK